MKNHKAEHDEVNETIEFWSIKHNELERELEFATNALTILIELRDASYKQTEGYKRYMSWEYGDDLETKG